MELMTEEKKRFKRTEVGVIPEDWTTMPLDALVSYTNGKAHEQSIDEAGQYIVVNSKFISTEGKVKKFTTENNCPAKVDDILMVMSDVPNGRAIAKCFYVDQNEKYTVNQRICLLNAQNVDSRLLFYILNRNKYYLAFDDGVKQTNLRKDDVLNCPIPLPPTLEEQQAIASALSDVDELIRSLDGMIQKKQAIKKGTMQQLLTGKKRLPGFDGEWVEKTLGDLCSEINDGTHYTPKYIENGVPFYSVENVVANNFSDVKYITREEHRSLIKRCKPEKGDILLTRIGTLAITKLIDWDIDASIYVSLALLKPNENVESTYLYSYTKSDQFVEDVKKRSLTNATPQKINMGEIPNVPIHIPSDRDEQIKIGQILLDLEQELQTLRQKREKYMQIKQGMMQELLTGKVRLV